MGTDRLSCSIIKHWRPFFGEIRKPVSHPVSMVGLVIRTSSSLASIRGDAGDSVNRCSRNSLRPIVAGLSPELRRLRCRVLSDTLSSGRPVSLSGVTVALSAHVTLADAPLVWTREHVETLLWFGLKQCASDLEIELPDDAARALHAILACCVHVEFCDSRSEAVSELFAPLQELASL